MAVEAIDGTDSTILRGGALADKEAVVVKIAAVICQLNHLCAGSFFIIAFHSP